LQTAGAADPHGAVARDQHAARAIVGAMLDGFFASWRK